MGSLVSAGQKGRTPVLISLSRQTVRAQHHKTRQILGFRPKAVGHPGPETRPDLSYIAAVHHHQRWLMVWNIGMHGAHNTEVVHTATDIGKDLADLCAILAELSECEWRG